MSDTGITGVSNRFSSLVTDVGWVDDSWTTEAKRTDWADMVDEATEVVKTEDGFEVVKPRRERKRDRKPQTSAMPRRPSMPRPPPKDPKDPKEPKEPKEPKDPEEPKERRIDDFDICSFNELCPNVKCPKMHCIARDVGKIIVDANRRYCLFALNGVECRFRECRMEHNVTCVRAEKCTVGGCILRHPVGHSPTCIECEDGMDCVDARCVGVHPEGWVVPMCEFSPFCLRVGKGCDKRHDPQNGSYRMIHKICNYKTNNMPCRHLQPCPYLDPSQYRCREGPACKYGKMSQCGFSHNFA